MKQTAEERQDQKNMAETALRIIALQEFPGNLCQIFDF